MLRPACRRVWWWPPVRCRRPPFPCQLLPRRRGRACCLSLPFCRPLPGFDGEGEIDGPCRGDGGSFPAGRCPGSRRRFSGRFGLRPEPGRSPGQAAHQEGQCQQAHIHRHEGPVPLPQTGQQSPRGGERVQHGGQCQQPGTACQQFDPCPPGRSQAGIQRRQRPDAKEHRNLRLGASADGRHQTVQPVDGALCQGGISAAALARISRQQPVAPQKGRHRQRQPGDGGDVEPLHQPEAKVGTVRIGQLHPTLDRPQHQSAAHHAGTGQPQQKVQPAQLQMGKAPLVQGDQHPPRFRGGPGGVVLLEQPAAGAVEHQVLRAHRHLTLDAAQDDHPGLCLARVVHIHPADALRPPAVACLRHHGRHVPQRDGMSGTWGRQAKAGDHLLLPHLVRARREGRQCAPGHVEHHQRHQSGPGDHQVKGQAQHGQSVVRIQPGALPLAPAEGEELGKDLLVRDDAADDRHQHEHGRHAHDPAPRDGRHVVQVEVEAVEELATQRLAPRERFAGARIQPPLHEAPGAITQPEQVHARRARRGQADAPLGGLWRPFRQPADHPAGHLHRIGRRFLRGHIRTHPGGNLVAEVADAAGQEHGIQQPAQQQAGPDVQVRHALAQAASTGRFAGGSLACGWRFRRRSRGCRDGILHDQLCPLRHRRPARCPCPPAAGGRSPRAVRPRRAAPKTPQRPRSPLSRTR